MAAPGSAGPAAWMVDAASGGLWHGGRPAADHPLAGHGVLAVAILILLTAAAAPLVRRLARDPLRGPAGLLPKGFRGRGLAAVRLAVGPWPEVPGRRTEVVVVLLSGGPVPVDVDGEIRWLRDGEPLRVGPGPGCVRRALPLHAGGVWMHLSPLGMSVEDPVASP